MLAVAVVSRGCAGDLCDAECHLVESDQRKAVFLSTVIRECGLTAKVHSSRIEALPDLDASVITARALAPLDGCFGF